MATEAYVIFRCDQCGRTLASKRNLEVLTDDGLYVSTEPYPVNWINDNQVLTCPECAERIAKTILEDE